MKQNIQARIERLGENDIPALYVKNKGEAFEKVMSIIPEGSLQELHPRQLLPTLAAGLITGIIAVIVSTAFATLIFSGDLASYIPAGIGLMLFASIVIGGLTALTSSFPGLVAGLQESAVAILALVSATIAQNLSASTTPQETFLTVVAAIALASLLTGAALFGLGQFKLGNLIRFIPYPVIGGFLAGTGLLLVLGALSMMVDQTVNLAQLPLLLQSNLWLKWLPGLVFGVLLLVVMRRYNHPWLMPGMLGAATVIFYGFLRLSNTSVIEATAQGWLLGPLGLEGGGLWQPFSLSDLQQVNWPVLREQIGSLAAIAVVSIITLLLNATGLELATDQDIDLNRELKAAGISNLVAGLGGGMVGSHVLSDTTLVYKMGARSRLVGLLLAAVCAIVLLMGGSLLSFFPNPVLGGLLLFLALDFLVTWVYEAWFKLPLADYGMVILILVVIATVGFLEGVGLGVALAVILFVVDYSRINVVRHTLSGTLYQSNFEHPRLYHQLLRRKGDWIYILELQGFIFFGTANKLLEQVRQRINDSNLPTPRFVVLDFRLVNGFDSSAVLSFARMKQLAQTHKIVLVFTQLSAKMQRQLEKEILSDEDGAVWQVYPDLDRGVEWCEEQIVQTFESVGLTAKSKTFKQQLEESLPRSGRFTRLLDFLVQEDTEQTKGIETESFSMASLMTHMERKDVEAGYYLIHQGDTPQGLYFIETGQVTVQLEQKEGSTVRLRTMGAGTVVGELGLYLGTPASASVVTDQPSTIYYLSTNKLTQMEKTDPQIAAAFHKFIAQRLGERLLSANDTLRALLK